MGIGAALSTRLTTRGPTQRQLIRYRQQRLLEGGDSTLPNTFCLGTTILAPKLVGRALGLQTPKSIQKARRHSKRSACKRKNRLQKNALSKAVLLACGGPNEWSFSQATPTSVAC